MEGAMQRKFKEMQQVLCIIHFTIYKTTQNSQSFGLKHVV